MKGSSPNSFRHWARNVIAVSRRQGKSDEQIARWIKAYAKKNNIPRGTYQTIGPMFGIYTKGRYAVKSTSRAQMGQLLKKSPKMQIHMAEIHKELKQWKTSVSRTLRTAKYQDEDISQVKREIIKAISEDWSKQSISEIIAAEDFIKRVFPELLQEETT